MDGHAASTQRSFDSVVARTGGGIVVMVEKYGIDVKVGR
jgi:hypothetical protein